MPNFFRISWSEEVTSRNGEQAPNKEEIDSSAKISE